MAVPPRTYPWQVGLRSLRDADPGADAGPSDRQGHPPSGLLAQVLITKYADHLPLYRPAQIFACAGVAIPLSTLAEWVGICGVRLQPLVDALRERLHDEPVLHTDETPVPMLAPGKKKTHRADLWAYATTSYAGSKAVIYDFSEERPHQSLDYVAPRAHPALVA